MKGDPVKGAPAAADMLVSSSELVGTETIWTQMFQRGLNELVAKMTELIRPASELRR
jgi:hypothetical protein